MIAGAAVNGFAKHVDLHSANNHTCIISAVSDWAVFHQAFSRFLLDHFLTQHGRRLLMICLFTLSAVHTAHTGINLACFGLSFGWIGQIVQTVRGFGPDASVLML